MKRIAVVGAGQLGRRHLEALVRMQSPTQIDVVDPSGEALTLAEEALSQHVPGSAARLVFARSLSACAPGSYDLVVVATTANVRAEVVCQLLAERQVAALVLEKVLFQRSSDLSRVGQLLDRQQVATWVNCPRRMYPFYRMVRDMFRSERQLSMVVSGGGWGLASNAIHFLDLLSFLREQEKCKVVDTSGLSPYVYASARRGFKEVMGLLRAIWSSGSELELRDDGPSGGPVIVRIRTSQSTLVIDESKHHAEILEAAGDGSKCLSPFEVPFQSRLTNLVAEEIFSSGRSRLTPYHESEALHRLLLDAVTAHFSRVTGVATDSCPIT